MKFILRIILSITFLFFTENNFAQQEILDNPLNWKRTDLSDTIFSTNPEVSFCIIQGKLVNLGGTFVVSRDGIRKNGTVYNFFTKQLFSPKSLSDVPRFSGVCSLESGIWIAGGIMNKSISSKVFFVEQKKLTDTSDIPSFIQDLQVPVKSPAVAFYDQNLYIAGGESASGPSLSFVRISTNIVNAKWQQLAKLPVGIIKTQLFVQSDGFKPSLFACVQTQKEDSTIILSYNEDDDNWIKRADYPGCLKNGIPTGTSFVIFSEHFNCYDTTSRFVIFNTITKQFTWFTNTTSLASRETALARSDSRPWLISKSREGRIAILEGIYKTYNYFTVWDYLILSLYLSFTVWLGLYMGGKQKSTFNYFKGDGKIPWWAVGVSILGTNLSAITFMSIPAKTYATNWSYFLLTLTVILVIPVVSRVFIPIYRKLNITSAYEYLSIRFSYNVRIIASLLYMLVEIGRVSIILVLPSLALNIVTGINVSICILVMGLVTLFYTFKGGIKAVIWTDVFQVGILLGGALLCLLYIPLHLPAGASEILLNLRNNEKINILQSTFNGSGTHFVFILMGGFTLNFLSFATDQTTVQRYLTAKDIQATRKSLQVGVWITVPAMIIFFCIGSLLYLFYYYNPTKVNISIESQDAIFPWYLVSQLPVGLLGLLIAAIFAAAMSALSSSLNSISTAFITDFYRKLFPGKTDHNYLSRAKLATLFFGLLSTSIALYVANRGIISLWDQFNTVVGLFTGGIGGIFLLGLFTEKCNTAGAIGGLICSGICQYLVSNYTNVSLFMYSLTGLVTCFVSGLIISYCSKPDLKDIGGLTFRTLKKNVLPAEASPLKP